MEKQAYMEKRTIRYFQFIAKIIGIKKITHSLYGTFVMKLTSILASKIANLHSSQSFAAPSRKHKFAPHQLRNYRLNGLVAALVLAVSPVVNADIIHPPIFTANQTVNVNGQYLPPNTDIFSPPPPPVAFSDSYTGNKLGESEYDFSSVPGITKGVTTWSNSIDDLGFVRTDSELYISHVFGNFDSFDNLKVEVSNTVSYYDSISRANLGGFLAYAIFETTLTGKSDNIVVYSNPLDDGAFNATYQTGVTFSSQLANSRGGADEAFEVANTESVTSGFFGSNIQETASINVDIDFAQQSTLGAVFFSFDYTDIFSVDIEGIDAGSIDIFMQNDLGSTVVTTASWYDENGLLLPFSVISESGFVYAQNAVMSSVSEPVPLVLFGAGLAVLGWSRRKKTL